MITATAGVVVGIYGANKLEPHVWQAGSDRYDMLENQVPKADQATDTAWAAYGAATGPAKKEAYNHYLEVAQQETATHDQFRTAQYEQMGYHAGGAIIGVIGALVLAAAGRSIVRRIRGNRVR